MENNLETLTHLITKDVRIVLVLQDQRIPTQQKRSTFCFFCTVILAHDSLLPGAKFSLLMYMTFLKRLSRKRKDILYSK